MKVPYFRPDLGDAEIDEVLKVLRSGWLTTGPCVRRFESEFAAAVGATVAVACNSATAALHLAVEALGAGPGQGVLVPTLTFAATAEVVRYVQAVPILVDSDPVTLNMDLGDAERKRQQAERGELAGIPPVRVTGIMPVHVGGLMMDVDAVREFAARHQLWIVEDAAHAFPASCRGTRSGENTAHVTCFSFYANKTMTTGEGGMAVTSETALADRMRLMSLHGLSSDAWNRYGGGRWDYRIMAPGFKYNLTDIAAAIGIHQLARAESMRTARERIAGAYVDGLSGIASIELPPRLADRVHAWHLFAIRLHLDRLPMNRDTVIDALQQAGVGTSVHWRPLHLHPYYQEQFRWAPEQFPVATREWERLISLPMFPTMTGAEIAHVISAITSIAKTA